MLDTRRRRGYAVSKHVVVAKHVGVHHTGVSSRVDGVGRRRWLIPPTTVEIWRGVSMGTLYVEMREVVMLHGTLSVVEDR